MKTIKLSYPHPLKVDELPPTACAIGFFDGIHKGHQKVIQEAINYARKHKMESAVMTFHPHPSVILKQEKTDVKYITPLEEKKAILQEMGIDRLYIITFNKKLSTLLPKDFINHFIIHLNIKHLVAGFDFTYGFKGEGNMENIDFFSDESFSYTVVPKVTDQKEKISSTRIRNLLKKGQISKVNALLGRPFQTIGTVVSGEKRGRTIGFPTANLKIDQDALLPKIGVYGVLVTIGEKTFQGMANLGLRPTFEKDQKEPLLEVYILDFNADLYGQEIVIHWQTFIRSEQQFPSVEALIEQLKKDEQLIRQYFKNYKETLQFE